jgi:hypothetical protein
MSIQPVSNSSNNPYINSLNNDLQTLQNDLKAFKSTQSSGNSDQVTLSQDALNKAMTQVQNDIASLAQQTQGAQGHHHHHHHGMGAAGNSSGSMAVSSTTPDPSTIVGNSYGSQSQNNASTINLTA